MDEKIRLLVTGGAGFIGSNFIYFMLKKHKNITIINLDKLTYAGNLENLGDVESIYGFASLITNNQQPRTKNYTPRYIFIKGDICDKELVDSIFSGNYFRAQEPIANSKELQVDICINFAAESHVDRSIFDSSPFIETNIKGTQVLLEATRRYWLISNDQQLTTKHLFLQISTDEVYGSIKKGRFTETSPLLPNSPYAASKAGADLLCRSYFKTYELPVVITRSSNNFGPYQFPEKFIPLAITNLLEGKPIPIYGDGKNVRDWIYVDNHCSALDLVIQKGKPGEIYNIAQSCEKKNIEVAKLICTLLNQESITNIQFIKDRLGHDLRYALDTTKICQELNWKPIHSFEEALKSTINWYITKKHWWRKIKTGEYLKYYKRMYSER